LYPSNEPIEDGPEEDRMGLDAYVQCRCWRDGRLSTPPPLDPSLIRMDEDEGFLDIVVPYKGHEGLHHRMAGWRANAACPHEEMELVSVRISNWSGVWRFRQAVDGAGGERRFPTLVSRIPSRNGGWLEPEEAAHVLTELNDLSGNKDLGTRILLIGDDVDRPIREHLGTGRTMLMREIRPRFHTGLDHGGFFVEDTATDPPAELFRSSRFTQEVAGEGKVCLTALDRDGRLSVSWPRPMGRDGEHYPRVLQVRGVALTTEDLRYIVNPLMTVCRAAVDTDSRVHWC
jgi:hypothetical protein